MSGTTICAVAQDPARAETWYVEFLSPMPRSYQEVLRRGYIPGRDFRITYGDSRIDQCLLIAPRGGGIEPGSSEIMRAVAETGGWAWYEFAGFLRQGNRDGLHIASTDFDEPSLGDLLPRTAFAVVFQGCNTAGDAVAYVGGQLKAGREAVIESMTASLRDHEIRAVDVMEHQVATHLRGAEVSNLANRGKLGKGIQLAFSREARNLLFPPDASREARGRRSARLRSLADSLHRAIQHVCPLAADQSRQTRSGAP